MKDEPELLKNLVYAPNPVLEAIKESMRTKEQNQKQGRSSRRKGKRGEYVLRDSLRALGYTADRVPSSGAAEGFKGDVKFSRDGKTWLAELKCRRDEYASIYTYFEANQAGGSIYLLTQFDPVIDVSIHLSDNMHSVLHAVPAITAYQPDTRKEYSKTLRKMANLKKLVKGCDVLVIKDDRKKMLYLRFL